jgi:hypothetical protein
VPHHVHARVGGGQAFGGGRRGIAAAIIDDHQPVNQRQNARGNLFEVSLGVIGRNDHENRPAAGWIQMSACQTLPPAVVQERMRTVFPDHYTWTAAISGRSWFIIL